MSRKGKKRYEIRKRSTLKEDTETILIYHFYKGSKEGKKRGRKEERGRKKRRNPYREKKLRNR